ncbi:hypothetical protein HDU93_002115, partial [Gonapodya sp. JEL0774]
QVANTSSLIKIPLFNSFAKNELLLNRRQLRKAVGTSKSTPDAFSTTEGHFATTTRLGLPTHALNKILVQLMGTPASIATRAEHRYGSRLSAVLGELRRSSHRSSAFVIRVLISRGLDVNELSGTALRTAAAAGSLEVVRTLVEECSANIYLAPTSSDHTALTAAILGGRLDIVAYLLRCDAGVGGFSPELALRAAVFSKKRDLVGLIVREYTEQQGVDMAEELGHALVHCAAKGLHDIVDVLATSSRISNIAVSEAAIEAARRGRLDFVELLAKRFPSTQIPLEVKVHARNVASILGKMG